MALSKLDLAAVAALALAMLWIEHEHRIVVAAPASAEAASAARSVCPATDDVPFSADCIAYIEGGVLPDASAKPNAAPLDAQRRVALHDPACPPNNENAPYSADCLKFLSGSYWQASPTRNAP
jgi:hypothetical protein